MKTLLQVTKHIVGQSLFQLAVMYGLVVYGDQLFGVANGHSVHGPSQHYTIVFNAFVIMQLFNQVVMHNSFLMSFVVAPVVKR